MKIINLIILLIEFLSFNAMAQKVIEPLKVGSKVPEFTLPDQNGKMFDIKNYLGKKNIVLFFYRKDFTSVCTEEVCSFRDSYNDFTEKDAVVAGISSQSVKSHKEFADKYKINYPLLSDENDKVREMFGAKPEMNEDTPGRVTYIINKTGKIVYIYSAQNEGKKHEEEALKALEGIK